MLKNQNTVFRGSSRPVTTEASLHVFGFGDHAVWVTRLKSSNNLWIQQVNAVKLVSEGNPAGGRGQKINNRAVTATKHAN